MFLFKNHKENEARRLLPDLFLFFKKAALYEVKPSGLYLSFNILVLILLNLANSERKLYKTLDY